MESIQEGRNSIIHRRLKHAANPSINSLNEDVLLEIFSQTVAQEMRVGNFKVNREGRQTWQKWSERTAPTNIAAVCEQWRNIALASPTLWSTYIYNSFDEREWKLLPKFLVRAKQAPLDIRIMHANYFDYYVSKKLSKLLIDHLSHTRSIHIIFAEDWPYNEIHLKHAPLLQHLRLAGCGSIHVDKKCIFHNLIFVDLTEGCPGGSAYQLNTRTCLELLQASPNMEVFRVECIKHSSPDAVAELGDIHLSKLSILEFSYSDLPALHGVFQKLHLPALKELTVDVRSADVQPCGLHDVLSRSYSSLEKFKFRKLNMSEILQVLELSPRLRDLTISETKWGGTLLRRLSITPAACLCPVIENLTLQSLHVWRGSVDDIESLIVSRWNPPTTRCQRSLRTVNLLMGLQMRQLPSRILACRDEGLEITVARPRAHRV